MLKYAFTRILWIIPVMLGVIVLVFTISYLSPGDPVALMMGGADYTPEQYAAKAAEFGLDKGYFAQIGTYIIKLVSRLDMGKSYQTYMPISEALASRIPVSFQLSLMSMFLMVMVGIPLGIVSALRQYSIMDTALTSISLILAAFPGFVLALLCALYFGLHLKWFPVSGIATWKAWIMPVFCSAGMGIASYTRMARTTMLEVIRQDYIRTARAKGLKESVVVRRHALKNCLIPLITIMGAQVARLFSGAVVIEMIFAIPGIGLFMYAGITSRDYPVITGTVFIISLLVCSVNLAVDLVYAFIDPRIKAQFLSRKSKAKLMKELAKAEGGA